jgi:hypothetical protein
MSHTYFTACCLDLSEPAMQYDINFNIDTILSCHKAFQKSDFLVRATAVLILSRMVSYHDGNTTNYFSNQAIICMSNHIMSMTKTGHHLMAILFPGHHLHDKTGHHLHDK